MQSASDALWVRVTESLSVLSAVVPSDAEVHQRHCEGDVAMLRVRFGDTDRAPLYVEFYRPSSTVVVSFGRHQNLSDYPVTEQNFHWYAEIIDAVARGGWSEEYFRFGFLTVCRAELPLTSGPASFHRGFPWVVRLAGAPYRVDRYVSWR